VNPPALLHIGQGRDATPGDSISRLLDLTVPAAQRENFLNDQNTQARRFGASVLARLHGQEPPEGGYTGAYVTDLAEEARKELKGIEDLPPEQAEPKLREFAIGVMVARIRDTVRRLNVHYDEWFRESRLWDEGLPQQAIERLREAGFLKDHAGALWFAPAI